MDGLKYCDSGGKKPLGDIDSGSSEPPMGVIVRSIRDYLMTPTPDDLDPLDHLDKSRTATRQSPKVDHTTEQADLNQSHESESSNQGDTIPFSSNSGKYSASVIGINSFGLPNGSSRRNSLFSANGEATDDEVEVDITADHPRLQGEFYQQLKRKYPRVFLRRCSATSDAASSVSSVISYRPAYRDSDMESNVSGYSRSSRRDVTKFKMADVGSRRSSIQERINDPTSGLPPRPPGGGSRTRIMSHDQVHHKSQRRRLVSTDSEFSDDDGLSDSASVVSAGTYNRRVMRKEHSRPPSGHTGRHPAGILKNGRSTPSNGLCRTDSTESIQDKLKQNQNSINQLFSENNSPFRHKYRGARHDGLSSDLAYGVKVKLKQSQGNMHDRSPTPFQLHGAKDLKVHLKVRNHDHQEPSHIFQQVSASNQDLNRTEYASDPLNDDYSYGRPITPKVRSKPPPPSHMPPRPPPSRKPAKDRHHNQAAMPTKTPIPKHVTSRRFSSPDSQHDSAIDLETSSQHSSPSSGSQSNGRMSRSEVRGQGQVITRPKRSRTPKLGRYKSEEKLASIKDNESIAGRDSDQDSGIVQNAGKVEVVIGGGRTRRDSESSSLDTDPEVDHQRNRAYPPRPSSASKLNSHVNSPRSKVTQVHSRSHVKGHGDRHGPIRADHYIQPVSPRSHYESSTSEGETEHWYPRQFLDDGPPQRAVSVADLSRRSRQSPAPQARVRFEDEVYALSPNRRSMSYPELHEIETEDHRRAMNGYLLAAPSNRVGHNILLSQSQEALYENSIQGHSSDFLGNVAHIPSPRATFEKDHDPSIRLGRAIPLLPPEGFQDSMESPRNNGDGNYDVRSVTSQQMSLPDEMDYSNEIYKELNASLQKKSKKPWKRNKGSFVPSEDNKVKGQKNVSRPNWKPPSGKPKQTSGGMAQTQNNKTEFDTVSENYYEEVQYPSKQESDPNGAVYANVKRSKNPHKKYEVDNSCTVHDFDDAITEIDGPELPARGYESDLEKYRDLSGSRSSLADRVAGLRDSARKKFKQFRRAVSLERLDKAGEDSETGSIKSSNFKKTPSLRSITERLSFRNKKKGGSNGVYANTPFDKEEVMGDHEHVVFGSMTAPATSESVTDPTHFRSIGRLKQLNPDGTQILELTKPPNGPFGFYIARGNVKYDYGVFVSRLSDGLPEHFFSGLLSIGDEILEVNNRQLKNIPLNTVYDWIAESDPLTLKVLPYLMRAET